MVKIRLARYGHKKAPFYRIVATSERSKREGSPLEVLGYFNPLKKVLKVDTKKIDEWVGKGAQITAAVKEIIETNGDIKKAKKKVKVEEKSETVK